MKRIIFVLLLLVLSKSFAQTDTASVFIRNLPATTKIDSNYINITESLTTTYKVTWKQMLRNMNWNLLLKAQSAYSDDYLPITHRNAGKDTTKAIKVSKFYSTLLKDSVQTDIGIAGTLIYQKIDSLDNSLSAEIGQLAAVVSGDSASIEYALSQLALKANKTYVDSSKETLEALIDLKATVGSVDTLNNRVAFAEGQISSKANITYVDSVGTNILSEVFLRARASYVDSIKTDQDSLIVRVSVAEAGVSANASLIAGLTGDVSDLESNLLLYALKDSLISYINLTPGTIKISSDKIELDGTVIADSLLYGEIISLSTLYTIDATNWIGLSTGNIYFNNFYLGNTSSKALSRNGNGNELLWDGNTVINTGNIGSYALTSYTETDPTISSWAKASTKPSYNYSEIGGTKPSYTFSEIGSKPTTLSGYGITDGVGTGGSYSNPSWITQLADSKIKTGSGGNAPAYFDGSGYLALGSVAAPISISAGSIGFNYNSDSFEVISSYLYTKGVDGTYRIRTGASGDCYRDFTFTNGLLTSVTFEVCL